MSFHPDKCKAVSIYDLRPDLIKILPFPKKPYMIGNIDIDYSVCQKDLGVLVNEKFRWEDHHSKILTKDHQMLGFTKRTCHFISDIRKRRSLYLSLVRSRKRPKFLFGVWLILAGSVRFGKNFAELFVIQFHAHLQYTGMKRTDYTILCNKSFSQSQQNSTIHISTTPFYVVKLFGLLRGRILYSCFDFIVLAKLYMLCLRFFETCDFISSD